MYQDVPRHRVTEQIRRQDLVHFASLLTVERMAQAAAATGLAIIQSPLSLPYLVWLALGLALSPRANFSHILTAILQALEDHVSFPSTPMGQARRGSQRKRHPCSSRSKHHPRKSDPTTPPSEEAFVQARQRVPLVFWQNLMIILADAFQQQHQEQLSFKQFRLLAMDGTRMSLPHWKRLAQYYGRARNQRAYSYPQARLVMMQFPFTRFPYRYELATLRDSELRVGQRLLPSLQPNDLLLLDTGFWSFSFFADVAERGAFFAIRLRADIKNLKTLLRYDDHEKLARLTYSGRTKKFLQVGSLDVRLLTYRIPGFRKQTMVTNQLDRQALSYDDWTCLGRLDDQQRLVQGLYSRRWEIETTFRELKVTQSMAGHLRSRTPASLQFEIAGHLLLYALTRWLMTNAAVQKQIHPLQLSFKHCLELLFQMRERLLLAPTAWHPVLLQRLLERMTSLLVIPRPGRRFLRRKRSSNHRKKICRTMSKLQA